MSTFQRLPRFDADWARLTPDQRTRFRDAVAMFVAHLAAGEPFRPGLRVKRVRGTADIWEYTWAPNGRATWQYGGEIKPGEPHVVWRRIGTHHVLRAP